MPRLKNKIKSDLQHRHSCFYALCTQVSRTVGIVSNERALFKKKVPMQLKSYVKSNEVSGKSIQNFQKRENSPPVFVCY